jgi:hypothetical protein
MSFLALLAIVLHGFLPIIEEALGVVTAEVVPRVFRRQFGVGIVRCYRFYRRAGAIRSNPHWPAWPYSLNLGSTIAKS